MEIVQPLVALVLVSIAKDQVRYGERPSPWLPLVGLVVVLFVAWASTRAAARAQRATRQPFHLPARLALLHLALFAGLVLGTEWIALAVRLTGGLPFVTELLAYLPFPAMVALRCVAAYEVERAAPGRLWTRGEYVAFHLRVSALPAVPLLVIQGVLDGLQRVPTFEPFVRSWAPLLMPAVLLVLLPLVFALSPALVRSILGARPLEPGPLRERLVAYGRRNGFRPTDILVWRTGNTITNALFIGVVPFFRYVVITDALKSTLDPAAIEAVYAHEAGHGVRRHTVLFLTMAAAVMLWSTAGVNDISPAVESRLEGWGFPPQVATQAGEMAGYAWAVGLFGLFLLGGIGWMSRRFETEADIHAVLTLEDPDDFGRALETIGLHLGLLRRSGGLRHFGIGQRLGLINRWRCEPEFREAFDRMLRRLRIAVVAFLAGGLLWFGAQAPSLHAAGRVVYDRIRAEESDDEAALRRIVDVANDPNAHWRARKEAKDDLCRPLAMLGDLALWRGDYEEARKLAAELEAAAKNEELIARVNARNLRVLVDVVDRRAAPEDVEKVVREVDRLVAEYRDLKQESLHETVSDLYLAHRAAGGRTDFLPGDEKKYTPAARLLRWIESTSPPPPRFGSMPADLRDPVRRDLERFQLRLDLLRRAAASRGVTWIDDLLSDAGSSR